MFTNLPFYSTRVFRFQPAARSLSSGIIIRLTERSIDAVMPLLQLLRLSVRAPGAPTRGASLPFMDISGYRHTPTALSPRLRLANWLHANCTQREHIRCDMLASRKSVTRSSSIWSKEQGSTATLEAETILQTKQVFLSPSSEATEGVGIRPDRLVLLTSSAATTII